MLKAMHSPQAAARQSLAGLLFVTCLGAQASPTEIAIDTAGVTGPVQLVYGSHTLNAALGSGFEVDLYSFLANAGDRINLVTSTSTAGVDAVITLRGPTGAVVTTTSCNGHAGGSGGATSCSVNLDSLLATTGTYTVNFADAGANNAGAYTLHLDQYPPVGNWVGFGYGLPTAFAIGHLGDSDYFAFNVLAGSQFRLSVGTQTAGLDAHVEVWNTTGQSIQSTSCNGHAGGSGGATTCNVLLDMTATADGYYKVGIYDVGWDNTGNYQIGVTCLFGTCATGVPSPIPEVPAHMMLGLGLAFVGWRRMHTSSARTAQTRR